MTESIYIPAIAGDGSLFPIEKMQAHLDGQLHLAVSVFVFDGDLLLMMGAGDIGHMSQHIASHGFNRREGA